MNSKKPPGINSGFIKRLLGLNQKMSKTEYYILSISYLVIFLLLWEYFFPVVIPRVGQIFEQLEILVTEKGILYELFQSINRVLKVMLIAVPISLFISASGATLNIMKPIAQAIPPFRFFALLGFAPIIRVLSGQGDAFQIYAFLFGIIPWMITGFNTLFSSIEDKELYFGRTMGYSELKNSLYVFIRGNAAAIYKIIRNNFAIAWMMMVSVEIANRDGGGIGARVFDYTRFVVDENLYAKTFAVNLIIFTCGIILDFLFRKLVLTLPEEKSKHLKH